MPEPYQYEVFEKNHSFTNHSSGKYLRNNQIWRKALTRDRDEVWEEQVAENHALMMYSPLLTTSNNDEPDNQDI